MNDNRTIEELYGDAETRLVRSFNQLNDLLPLTLEQRMKMHDISESIQVMLSLLNEKTGAWPEVGS